MAIKDLTEKVISSHSEEMGGSLKINKDEYDNLLQTLLAFNAFEEDQTVYGYDVNVIGNVDVEIYVDADYVIDKTKDSYFGVIMDRCDIFKLSTLASENTTRLHFIFNNIWKDYKN